MKQSEKLFEALSARAAKLGRRLNKREWFESVDAFFASQKRRGGTAIHPDAEAIYLAYPRHVGRELALRAISNAIDRAGGDSDSIMEATGAYCAAVKTWPKAYRFKKDFNSDTTFDQVPHPSSWYNAGRHLDDRANWPVYGNRSPIAAPVAGEPSNWREYLLDQMPDCVYIKTYTEWAAIDLDLQQYIMQKMKSWKPGT